MKAFSSLGALLSALGAVATLGCGGTAAVSSNLPLQRVVVYRNGIAYFERGGTVEESEVRFKMKEGAVGDFLATLAVMEKGGSSVRAAAFPIASPDDVPECDPNPLASVPRRRPPGEEPEPRLRPCTDQERRHIREVVLQLDGKQHDLQVGYVTEAPMWRPSYRLVVEGNGVASMQAWGIVQNLSGEDWTDVRLSLVAGAPVAFEATLGTPIVPTRPTVTDEGEVVAAVPRAETSLAQQQYAKQDAPSPEPAAQPAEALDDADGDEAGLGAFGTGAGGGGRAAGPARSLKKEAKKPSAPRGGAMRPGSPPPPPPPPPPAPATRAPTTPSGPRDLRSLAAISATSGVTRYDLPLNVTIPDKSATMVMLLAKKLPGDAAFLYAPDGAVPGSFAHPFRVVRFVNKSGGALERGPIAVFDHGAFLGQGMVDPLPEGATATVPFALDRGVAVDRSTKHDELGERVQKIENGELTIERDSATQTLYRLRNGAATVAKVLVKHSRISGSHLEKPPAGTEDNVGTGSALVPYDIQPRSEGELLVDERVSLQRSESWMSPVAEAAVKALLASPGVDTATKTALTEAWGVRAEILRLNDIAGDHQRQLGELSSQSEETRRSLRSIEKNKLADKLRVQLTKRLEDLSKRSEEVGKKLVESQAKLAELNVRFRDLVRSVKYVAQPSTKR
ncbi:MAG TPA: hypothetical protein PLR99_11910 [Polyangiaceae bacterium]|nr:hypothetical protein [Polyangiaceae bacterium]